MPAHCAPRGSRRAHRPAVLVVAVAAVIGVFVAAALIGLGGRPAERPAPIALPGSGSGGNVDRPGERWLSVLERLDQHRDQAWRTGDPVALRRAFAVGSRPLLADRAALRRYLDCGYAVRSARLSFWDVHVVARDKRGVTLRVVDRLGRVMVTHGAGAATPLPDDRPSRHRITLARGSYGWRITSVQAV